MEEREFTSWISIIETLKNSNWITIYKALDYTC